MVRRDATSWLGIHAHDPGSTTTVLSSGETVPGGSRHRLLLERPAHDGPVVRHFVSRGHLDVMRRIIGHRFFDAKSGDRERSRLTRFLVEPANWSNIPTRCLQLQFYRSLPVAAQRPALPAAGAGTDCDALRRSFVGDISTLVDFSCADPPGLEQAFEARFRFAVKSAALRRLASLRGFGVADLDAYLAHRTQEGYTAELRRCLEAVGDGEIG